MRPGPRDCAGLLLLISLSLAGPLAGQGSGYGASSSGAPVLPATFWWDASVGAGSSQVSCRICAKSVDTGPFLTIAAGAYGTARTAVGVELGGWTHRDGETRERILQGAVSLRYARDPRRGVHFLAGAGWMHYRAGEFSYHSPQLQLGVGWTLPVSGPWGMGGRLLTDISPLGSLRRGEATVADGVRIGTIRLSLFLRRN